MPKGLICLFVFCASFSWSQSINEKLVNVSFKGSIEKQPAKKQLLIFKKRASYFNPLNYLGAGLLYTYQNLVSEQIQASCTYEISCSEFTKFSIQRHGFFIGTLKGFNQLSECINAAKYEHPRVFLNNNHKIINSVEEKDK